MVNTGRGNKSSSEWELYGRSLRTPQETRQKGKGSETIQFQEARRDIVYVNREENHLLYIPFLNQVNLLSLYSKNKFDILLQDNVVYNDVFDVYDDDILLNDDFMGKGCQNNTKSHPKYSNKNENKLYQNYKCKENDKILNVKYMKNDANKMKEKYLKKFH